jgi:hypothetical protein
VCFDIEDENTIEHDRLYSVTEQRHILRKYRGGKISDTNTLLCKFYYDTDCILQVRALRKRNAVNKVATIQNPQICRLCERKPDNTL